MPKRRSMLAAAEVILAKSTTPLHSNEIIALALSEGLIDTPSGKTPNFSLQSAIWRDMQRRKGESPFTAIGRGRYRAYWLKSKIKTRSRS